uniref:SSD domain-containing protein n=1 Tax=Plectus sambesii TaxID=2011161 RepID=A0A914VSK8_9BILA
MERRSESAVTAGRPRRSRARLKDRVAHAYYDYGRLCSSHPFSCLSFSIITFVLLSYPAIGRLRLPSSSPVDVHWSDTVEVAPGNDVPEWLQLTPSVYLQQIVVKGKVDPWNQSTLTQEMAVKGPLSRAFTIQKRLREFVTASNMRLDKQQCFHVHDKPAMPLLPDHGCLVLTPALFWENDEEKFFQDDDVIAKIFKPSCTPSMCPRELLLGMPTGMTGIKRKYSTNRQRDIDYSITIVLSQHRPEYISALKASLASLPEFEAIVSKGVDESTFVHVFYRPRKYFSDYFPLVTLYIVFLLYIYFSASKFEMVKSKWGLAFAAVLTVASTLTMTMGICAQLDITPTLWGAELFPYLAMIVGLENTLCITRAVVYTPPTLDVRSRLAHGLSHEGYSITKNFLTELVILAAGFFTFVPEIQEFCTFAVIGLVVDFYMQLFFYAPCLTFDLLRMGAEDKQRFSLMLFKSDPVELQVYPAIKCPMQRLWPRLFEGFEKSGQGLFRVKSESGLNEALVGESTTPIRPACEFD